MLEKFSELDLHNLCRSPDVIRVIKSKRTKWSGHVARLVVQKYIQTLLLGVICNQ